MLIGVICISVMLLFTIVWVLYPRFALPMLALWLMTKLGAELQLSNGWIVAIVLYLFVFSSYGLCSDLLGMDRNPFVVILRNALTNTSSETSSEEEEDNGQVEREASFDEA